MLKFGVRLHKADTTPSFIWTGTLSTLFTAQPNCVASLMLLCLNGRKFLQSGAIILWKALPKEWRLLQEHICRRDDVFSNYILSEYNVQVSTVNSKLKDFSYMHLSKKFYRYKTSYFNHNYTSYMNVTHFINKYLPLNCLILFAARLHCLWFETCDWTSISGNYLWCVDNLCGSLWVT